MLNYDKEKYSWVRIVYCFSCYIIWASDGWFIYWYACYLGSWLYNRFVLFIRIHFLRGSKSIDGWACYGNHGKDIFNCTYVLLFVYLCITFI